MKNNEYSFRVLWNVEDDVYVAICPEFDGVSGFGSDPGEAIKEAETALRLAIEAYRSEGWSLPEPEYAAEYSGQFRIRVPRNLHAQLVQQAADEGVSLNTYAVSLLSAHSSETQTLKEIKIMLSEQMLKLSEGWGRGSLVTSDPKIAPNLLHPSPGRRWTDA